MHLDVESQSNLANLTGEKDERQWILKANLTWPISIDRATLLSLKIWSISTNLRIGP